MQLTSYPVVPLRVLFPEKFTELPLGATQSKKELLLSMKTVLEKSDELRNKEVRECENFTRCKVLKAPSGKSHYYEYHDMDLSQQITPEEYEKR